MILKKRTGPKEKKLTNLLFYFYSSIVGVAGDVYQDGRGRQGYVRKNFLITRHLGEYLALMNFWIVKK